MLNKTIRLKRLNITILLLLLGGCTSTLNDDSLTIEKDLSLNEAREIYEKHNALIATKSQVSPNNFFQRNVAGLLWDKAKSSSNEKTSCVDIPILSDYIYGAFLKDAKGKMYISKCYHSITVLKTKKNNKFYVYNHFYFPEESLAYEDKGQYNDNLYRNYTNNEKKTGFSGIEVFSTLEGKIVTVNKYISGKIIEHSFIGAKNENIKAMTDLLNSYFYKVFHLEKRDGGSSSNSQPKTKVDYVLCDICNYYLFYMISECAFMCANCGYYMYLSGFNGTTTLDEITIIADGEGYSGGSGDDYDPTPPGDDEGGNGGDGGDGGDDGGNGGDGGQSAFVNWNFDARSETHILPAILTIIEDCAGSALMNSISDLPIQVIYTPNLEHLFDYYGGSNRLLWDLFNPVEPAWLVEELVHILQIENGWLDTDSNFLNAEIEARMACFLYALHNNCLYDLSFQWGIFQDYYLNPTDNNYQVLINYLRTHGYANVTDYPENSASRSFDNLFSIFDCYGANFE